MMRRAILVVGTGRSGTSAMAGTLKILGAYLGEDLKPGDGLNAKGYFENTRITDLNKALLSAADVPWYDPEGRLPMGAEPVTTALCGAIRTCIEEIFAERTPILIKDPRLCVLIDAYAAALRDARYDLHVVRMLRDPLEVARSMAMATNIETDHWIPIARRHAELLEAALRRVGVNWIDCTFDDLIAWPEVTIARIATHLPFLPHLPDRVQAVVNFIDRSLKHH